MSTENLQEQLNEIETARDNIQTTLESKGETVSSDIRTFATAVNNLGNINTVNGIGADENRNAQIDASNINVDDTAETTQTIKEAIEAVNTELATKVTKTEAEPFINEVTFDNTTFTFTFKNYKGETQTFDLPLESTVQSGKYDSENKALVLVLQSGDEVSIPVNELCDVYTGKETDKIKVTVNSDNSIEASIIEGTIAKTDLTSDLQAELNSKSTASNLVDGEAEGSLRSVNSTVESDTYKVGANSMAVGKTTQASGNYSFAAGINSKATGVASAAVGSNTLASNQCSFAEGNEAQATGSAAHAEGISTKSIATASHAEGQLTKANANWSHAEGYNSEVSSKGNAAHAEGMTTQAVGTASHAEGNSTVANGNYSHAEGGGTIASGNYQHVEGRSNIEDTENKYVHIAGNGDNTTRSNAHTVAWDGTGWYAGNVKVGGTGQDDETAKTLATTEYVDNAVANIDTTALETSISNLEAKDTELQTGLDNKVDKSVFNGNKSLYDTNYSVEGVYTHAKVNLAASPRYNSHINTSFYGVKPKTNETFYENIAISSYDKIEDYEVSKHGLIFKAVSENEIGVNVDAETIDFDTQELGMESTTVAPAIRELKTTIDSLPTADVLQAEIDMKSNLFLWDGEVTSENLDKFLSLHLKQDVTPSNVITKWNGLDYMFPINSGNMTLLESVTPKGKIYGTVADKDILDWTVAQGSVELYDSSSTLIDTVEITETREYLFENVEAGDGYSIIVKIPGYLNQTVTTISVADGYKSIIEEVSLMGGDIVVDGEIELDDLVTIADVYGFPVTDSTLKYDLDRDGAIGSADRNILKTNYSELPTDIVWAENKEELPLEMVVSETATLETAAAYSYTGYNIQTAQSKVKDGHSTKLYSNKADLIFILENNIITNVVIKEAIDVEGNFLDTETNYKVAYIPKYNGSPATKIYVDDTVSAAKKELNSTIKTNTTNITTNTTNITNLTTEVGTKAAQTDLDTTNTNVADLTTRVTETENSVSNMADLMYEKDPVQGTEAHDGTYYFVWDGTNKRYVSNNHAQASTTATSTLTIPSTGADSFYIRWTVSSEYSFDKFSLVVDGTTVVESSYSLQKGDYAVDPGATVTINYSKDSSGDTNDDQATVQIIPFNKDVKASIGYVMDSVSTLDTKIGNIKQAKTIDGEVFGGWHMYSDGECLDDYGWDSSIYDDIIVGNILTYPSSTTTGNTVDVMISWVESGSGYKSAGGRYFYKIFGAGNSTYEISQDSLSTGKWYKGLTLDENASSEESGGVACFTAGTKVLVEDGYKNIEDIQLGDKVYSYNTQTMKNELKEVDKLVNHETDIIFEITAGAEKIKTTWSHPFYTFNKGRCLASNLEFGDILRTADNCKPGVLNVAKVSKSTTVYEIRVKDNYNYYVGNTSILVFNEQSVIEDTEPEGTEITK